MGRLPSYLAVSLTAVAETANILMWLKVSPEILMANLPLCLVISGAILVVGIALSVISRSRSRPIGPTLPDGTAIQSGTHTTVRRREYHVGKSDTTHRTTFCCVDSPGMMTRTLPGGSSLAIRCQYSL